MLEYSCEECNKELTGEFGEDVTCSDCKITYGTDWDYVGDSIACWITEKVKK